MLHIGLHMRRWDILQYQWFHPYSRGINPVDLSVRNFWDLWVWYSIDMTHTIPCKSAAIFRDKFMRLDLKIRDSKWRKISNWQMYQTLCWSYIWSCVSQKEVSLKFYQHVNSHSKWMYLKFLSHRERNTWRVTKNNFAFQYYGNKKTSPQHRYQIEGAKAVWDTCCTGLIWPENI